MTHPPSFGDRQSARVWSWVPLRRATPRKDAVEVRRWDRAVHPGGALAPLRWRPTVEGVVVASALPSVAPDRVLAFRLHRAGLTTRARHLDVDRLAPLGLQDAAANAVAHALALRTTAPMAGGVAAMVEDGRLVPTWGPRRAAHLSAAEGEDLLGPALLDDDPEQGSVAQVATELVHLALEAIREHGPMTKAQLGAALLSATPAAHVVDCQRCGRRHPSEDLVRTLVWTGRLRLQADGRTADRVASAARARPRRYRRVTDEQRAESVRRFLSLYAPTTVTAFAEWAGIEPAYARRCWRLVEDDVVAVEVRDDHGQGWCLSADLEALQSAESPAGMRLVPAYDPYLQARDRGRVAGADQVRRTIWRAVANPGVVLDGTTVVGTWRARQRSRWLDVEVTAFAGARLRDRDLLPDAERLALAVGADDARIAVPR